LLKEKKEIYACKSLFFSISFFVGLWTIRIPDIKDQILTDYSGLSYLFVIFSLGSILTMIVAPKIIEIFSSKIIVLISGSIISFLWIFVPFVTSFLQMAFLSFLFGCAYGIFEVVLNLQATNLEKKYDKPMMSGFHAFWSIGLLSGSFITSIFLEYRISFLTNSITYIFILFPLIFVSSLTLKTNEAEKQSFAGIFFKWPIILMVLVLLSITAVFLEGGTDSWGALYMRDYLQAEGFNIGLAAIAFNGAMVIGRLTGDQFKTILGIQKFLFISIVCSLLGVLIVLLSKVVLFAIIGFVIAGLGVSSVIPICYTLASSIKNINPTVGITVITIAVYGDFMIAPPILGYTANIIGIQYVYLPIVILFIISTLILIIKKREL
tara:strand:+ start:300 stop:1436 length:1137 start_codon:yes stop_codon:yes gene_type:complete